MVYGPWGFSKKIYVRPDQKRPLKTFFEDLNGCSNYWIILMVLVKIIGVNKGTCHIEIL